MRRFDEKVNEIETQLNEFEALRKGANWLGKQGKNIIQTPVQAVSSTGQLVKKGLDGVADLGRGAVDAVQNPGDTLKAIGSGLSKTPELIAKGVQATGRGIADVAKNPAAAGRSFTKAVADYVPNTVKSVANKATDTLDSLAGTVDSFARGDVVVGPDTIANLSGTKRFDNKPTQKTVTGRAIDTTSKAIDTKTAALNAANPSHAAGTIASDTVGNYIKDRSKKPS